METYRQTKYRRRSIRLKDYDYATEGAYFVIICTQANKPYFEAYPELRQIIQTKWESLPERFSSITLYAFIIMPNHIHAIIIVGATLAVAQERAGASPAPTLGDIVGTFKSLCANEWLKHIKHNTVDAPVSFWQRNYYEHVIRNEKELNRIREYIWNNPLKWVFDRENPDRIVDAKYVTEWKWLEGA